MDGAAYNGCEPVRLNRSKAEEAQMTTNKGPHWTLVSAIFRCEGPLRKWNSCSSAERRSAQLWFFTTVHSSRTSRRSCRAELKASRNARGSKDLAGVSSSNDCCFLVSVSLTIAPPGHVNRKVLKYAVKESPRSREG